MIRDGADSDAEGPGWKDQRVRNFMKVTFSSTGEYDEVIQIVWSDEVGQFMLMANDGTLSPGDKMTVEQTKLAGNIYESPAMVPQL